MKKIVFYDTETTGLPEWKIPSDDPKQPHLVQLAAIQCNAETREVLQKIDLIIRPDGWEISQEMTDIHGISHEKAVECGISEIAAVSMLLGFCNQEDTARVAHNRTFDQRIIRIALKRYDYFDTELMDYWAEKENHHCTMLMAKPIMQLPPYGKWGWKNPKLEEAYEYFCGKKLGGSAHNAMADTQACMEVYWVIQDWENAHEKNKFFPDEPF
jgi:DNA polymerase-3 subunit epsilon